jgi:hypothetical protein
MKLVMGKIFSPGIELVQNVIGTHPQVTGGILEQGVNVRPPQAIGPMRVMREDLEPITIVANQTEFRPEPDEALIILNNLPDVSRGHTLQGRQVNETQVVGIHHWQLRNDRRQHQHDRGNHCLRSRFRGR